MKYLILPSIVILISLMGCSSVPKLTSCSSLSKSDSTQYFVSGLMDHTELNVTWLKEEVKKEHIADWLRSYIKKGSEQDSPPLPHDERQNIEITTFNEFYSRWKAVENKITEADKIYYYSTPDNYWSSLAGQDGLVVIRDCKIMYVLILSQS